MPENGALVKWDGNGTLSLGSFSLLRVGLLIQGSPSFEEWEQIGKMLGHIEGAVHWWIGDWLNDGERRWGQESSQALEPTGFDEQTCKNDAWVAGSVDLSRRRDKLSWSHHAEVAGMQPAEQESLLLEAEQEGLSSRQLRERVRETKAKRTLQSFQGCTVEDLGRLIDTGKTFGAIYADPPWQYGNQGTRAATDNHYQTMTVEDLADLPISALAADPCHLHLWTTNGFLREALDLIGKWGFAYKSAFVWVKPQIGIGNYWRVSHEFLLLGVRGEQTFLDKSLRSWGEYDRTEHSSKPEQVRRAVEAASPGPYLELFGRKAVEGWVVWGNEVSRDLFTQQVEAL